MDSMNDVTITTTTHMLDGYSEPRRKQPHGHGWNSSCLVIKKENVTHRHTFWKSWMNHQQPNQMPWQTVRWHIDNIKNSKRLKQETKEKLVNIDKTRVCPGNLKHGISSMNSYPKLVLKNNNYLRRWMRVPLSFSSVGYYSKTTKLRLPLPSVVELFKTGGLG